MRQRRPSREQVRERLFTAADALLAEDALAGASVSAITDAADLSRGALYSNFESREHFLLALLEWREKAQLVELRQLAEITTSTPGFVEALRARNETRSFRASAVLQLELWFLATQHDWMREELSRQRGALRLALETELEGVLTGIDARLAALVVGALEDGFRIHRAIEPSEAASDLLLDALDALVALTGKS